MYNSFDAEAIVKIIPPYFGGHLDLSLLNWLGFSFILG